MITYHFPPDGAVGGLRWSGLSRHLARLGWDVHVISAAACSNEPIIDGVYRHECARRRTLNDFYARFAARRREDSSNSTSASSVSAASAAPKLSQRIVFGVRMLGRIVLGFPDVGRGWVLRAARIGRALHKQHPFDAVITSGPPHSAHFAGLLVTLGKPSVERIADMRDPWRGGNLNWPIYGMDPRWLYRLIGPLERVLYRTTRTVIVNTLEFARELQAAEPQLSVIHVSNGVDLDTLPARTAERFGGVSIAYVGTFYAGRSFTTLLAALKSVVRARPDEARAITLRIAGQMDAAQGENLRATLARDNLGDLVELRGRIPRAEALDLLRRSQLALVLAQEQRTQIPAKLYECVGLGVPTLVITEADSAAAREARRIGAMVVEPDDMKGMHRVLDDLLDGRLPTRISSAAPVSYEALARHMDQILANCGAPDPTGMPGNRHARVQSARALTVASAANVATKETL